MPNNVTWTSPDGLSRRFGTATLPTRVTHVPTLIDSRFFCDPISYHSHVIRGTDQFYGATLQETSTIQQVGPWVVNPTTSGVPWSVSRASSIVAGTSLVRLEQQTPSIGSNLTVAEGISQYDGGTLAQIPTANAVYPLMTNKRCMFLARVVMGSASTSASCRATVGFVGTAGDLAPGGGAGVWLQLAAGALTVTYASSATNAATNTFTVSGLSTAASTLLVEGVWDPEQAAFHTRVVDPTGVEQFATSCPNSTNPKLSAGLGVFASINHYALAGTTSVLSVDTLAISQER